MNIILILLLFISLPICYCKEHNNKKKEAAEKESKWEKRHKVSQRVEPNIENKDYYIDWTSIKWSNELNNNNNNSINHNRKKYSFLRLKNVLFTEYNESDLCIHHLPTCFIIPLSKSYNTECKGYKYNDPSQLKEWNSHNVDHLIHNWLMRYYEKTVSHTNNVDSFFLPAYIRDCYEEKELEFLFPWRSLEKDISEFANKVESFNPDRTFISATYPLDHPEMTEDSYSNLRYIFDIRYLRVDNSLTLNARDVYVPYYYPTNNINNSEQISRRNFLFFAPCRAPPSRMEFNRKWREKAYNSLKKINNSNVYLGMTEKDFQWQLHNNDFCIILPGDTTSTAKLYKAIFAGCIPVVFISYYEQLPFSRFVDWKKFAILSKREVLNFDNSTNNLVNKMISIRNNITLLMEYKRNLLDVSILFNWDNHEWPSVYHFILLELIASSKDISINRKKVRN